MAEKELTYESAFPGRFLKAALFEGRQVTLTIEKAYMEELESEKGKEKKLIFAFAGKTMELVVNKTNALCMKEMFGNKVASWVGKRVTFYPTDTNFGPKKVDCIRIFGSPDIEADVDIAARIGRKNLKVTLRKTANGKHAPKPPQSAIDPRIAEAFLILDWTPAEQAAFLAHNSTLSIDQIYDRLNRAVDERAQKEA